MAFFSTERHDQIAVVTFTRPPRNLMSMAAMGELEVVLQGLATDDDVNVVLVTGGVPGFFVAHADLDDLAAMGRGETVEGDPGSWVRVCALLESMPQPTVAAINGQAWGGGCEISLACTLRVAAASAHLGQPEVAVGIFPGAGGTQRLPRLIGAGRAAQLILSARIIGAHEAELIGLVEAVLPDEGFLDAAIDWVTPIATKPRRAVIAAKKAIIEGSRVPLDQGLRIEGEQFLYCQMAPETVALQEVVAEAEREGTAW